MYFFDAYGNFLYIVLVLPVLAFSLFAQMRVQSTFLRYNKEKCRSGLTGAQVARRILDDNGLYDVAVAHVQGSLSDHFDPSSNTVRLSDSTFQNASIAALGVAAHETGHAVQHATGYAPLKIRSAIIPVSSFGAQISIPLFLAGYFMSYDILMTAGILLFALMALFQIITLPVEFNASRRALSTLQSGHYLRDDEMYGAQKVLYAAALTYVAALLSSIMQLLRLVLMRNRKR